MTDVGVQALVGSSSIANEQQFREAVEEGKRALRDGRVVEHATVVAAFERLLSQRGLTSIR